MADDQGRYLAPDLPKARYSVWVRGYDAKAGWKGKALWTTSGTRAPFHSETGKGTPPKVYQFQFRPDPLAS